MNIIIIVVATLIHLLPHPAGFSPVGAMALYSGAYAKSRIAWAVPIVPLLLSGFIVGFYNPVVMAFVYGGFGLSALVAKLFIGRKQNLRRHALAVVASSFTFYLVSNFSVWLVGMYPQTLAGLVQCYINGLPFLGVSFLANAAFGGVMFGLHHWLESRRRSEALTA